MNTSSDRGRRNPLVWLGIAAVLFGVGYLFATFVLFPPLPVPEDGVVVPDLGGISVEVAEERLRPLGLVIGDTLSFPVPTVAPGRTVAQSPLPGQQLRARGRVSLGLSSGMPAATVPDVTGLAVARAENLLKRLGFEVEQTLEESDRPNGTVIQSSPEAGARTALPARVRISVSSGPVDTAQVDTVVRRDTIF